MPHRTYDEDEVAALLRRAAELQAEASRRGPLAGSRPGLTLEELAAAAADAGLDPEYLRQAAAEGGAARSRAARVSKTEIVADRWVPGELTEEAKEEVVVELRHRFEGGMSGAAWGMGAPYGTGALQTIGRSVEWSYVNPGTGTQTRVLLQPREGGVRVRAARSNTYSGLATAWTPMYAPFLAFFAAIIAGPFTGSFAIGAVLALLTLAVSAPLLSRLDRRSAERQREEVERLADEIAAHVRPPGAEPPQRAAAPGAGPRLDLPDEGAWGEAEGEGEREGSARRRRER